MEVVKQLADHFDIALDTPDGIEKLRGLILALAMQGKLVPQSRDDQPATELLGIIEAEKSKLVDAGEIRKQEILNVSNEIVKPYEIPANWTWCYLDNLCSLITDGTHHTPTYVSSGVPFISVKNLSSGYLDFSGTKFISTREHNELKKRCCPQKGDILLTKIGTTGIAVAIDTDEEFSIFVSVALLKLIKPYISPEFLTKLISSPLVRKYSADGTEGVGNKNLVLRKIKSFLVPLPPLAEQKRIVAKIDQLMALCDKLEAERKARDEKRITVHTAAVNRLLAASDKPAFDGAWQFITKHFAELYAVQPNVAELRKAILQLAVMGKLVPQDANDQPASELLKEIEVEKARLVAEGKIKKQAPLPPIKAEEIPYALPQGWEWVRLENYGYLMGGGTPSTNKSVYWEGDVPWVCPKDMKVPYISRTIDTITELAIKESSAKWIPNGSVLFVVRGMILAHTFPVAINSVPVALNQDMKALIPYVPETNEYLLRMLKGFSQKMLSLAETSTHGTRRLEYDKSYGSVLIPLPPLAEQQRIVAKVDDLMRLCDALEKHIGAAEAKQEEILDAVLAQVGDSGRIAS